MNLLKTVLPFLTNQVMWFISHGIGCFYFSQNLLHSFYGTVKWGDIEQSYLFHGNLLFSEYNSHVARCLCHRSATEGFCSPDPKFLKCPHNLWLFFCLKSNFQTKEFYILRRSLDRKLFSPNRSRVAQKHLFDLHVS